MRPKRKWLKVISRIVAVIITIVIIVLLFFVYRFAKSKTDESIFNSFKEEVHPIYISRITYKDHLIRVFSMQKILDTTLPVLVFVHGSPGSGMDFKRYLKDADLNKKANLISYDRIGYSVNKNEKVFNNLEQELEVLQLVIPVKEMYKVIVVGYSYGGSIVAASPKKYKSKILLAPAIKGELEPMLWVLNLYRWKITRPIVPNVFQNAAKEKMYHLTELPRYENKWTESTSPVLSIHGDKDRIVPYKNSLFLKSKFKSDSFELITIPDGNHGLLWNKFDLIKSEILKVL